MRISFTKKALKAYESLPLSIKKKADKQFIFLVSDIRHPSLRIKKMQGYVDIWECRIDYHYRFTIIIEEQEITVRTIGPHDQGLGKK
ncbi:hypothetical protein KJ980_05855 [Patescibacteria group bacterium]|nr:hypothetical protein [Patescibacteria group bacterium]MBU4016140.1 hypothetical protein [Patescibacteria group bacterium]MBU4099144.1 hypothetical protein [Patescibacteria group bacterium]